MVQALGHVTMMVDNQAIPVLHPLVCVPIRIARACTALTLKECNDQMPKNESVSTQSASEQIFSQIEQSLEAGGVRDVWQNLQKELAEGGMANVRTYLDAEYQRRRSIIQSALDELSNQLEEVN